MAAKYTSRKWQRSMRIRYDYNNMMSEFVGDEQGLSKADVNSLKVQAKNAFDAVQKDRGTGWRGWMDLPFVQDEIADEINAFAKAARKKFDYFVVLGIGGSALGAQALMDALAHLRYNELPKAKRKGPKFYVEDNVDPERMQSLLDVIDVGRTLFNVVTKSGATSETMAQFLIVKNMLDEKLGSAAAEHIVATTDEKKGDLVSIARAENIKTYYIPSGVGGRFSVLSPVGLLPAAMLGVDVRLLLAGAAYMDDLCRTPNLYKNPALIAAVMQYLAYNHGKNVSVMMPYADSLRHMADWYCQLWAESLGKAKDRNGYNAYAGQTPTKALGVTDQHSQVQLYTEGPFDKVVTFIGVDSYRTEFAIPRGYTAYGNVGFLGGHTLNELISAERQATAHALTAAHRLNATITLPCVNAFTIGELIFFFEMQTAFSGELFNVDAYDQPGVEEGKRATFALLDKPGFEAKRAELESAPPAKEEYIC